MIRHYLTLTLGSDIYEFATFYRGLGHSHPHEYSVLGGPDPGCHQPPHERPSVEPARDEWSVELPVVLWLLDVIGQGVATAEGIRRLLLECSSPSGGCCWGCEAIDETEEVVVTRCAQAREAWLARWSEPTPESHPYAATGSSLHAWNCRTLVEPVPPPVITSKHEYVRYRSQYDHGGGRRQPYTRLTGDEAKEWRSRRCKICAPALPGAWRDETSDVPSTY